MGFWKALDEIFPSTKHQRCWVHKVKNVLNHFPKPMTAAVKSDLNDIQHAETRAEALVAIDLFKEKYSVKFEKAVVCLTKSRDELLAFHDFPAERAQVLGSICEPRIHPLGHVNMPCRSMIESVFATVRHRTVRPKGALSQKTAKLMVFTLIQAASKNCCA